MATPTPINPISALTVSESAMADKLGDYRVQADLASAEKLAAQGINKRDMMGIWAEAIAKITKEIKYIEAQRDVFLAPIAEIKRQVESTRKKTAGFFDGPISVLEAIKGKLNGPYAQFVYKCKQEDDFEAKRIQDEAAAKAEKKAKDEGQSDFMAGIEAEEAAAAAPVVQAVTKQVSTVGSTSLRMTWAVKLVDISKVPARYLVFNDALAMKDFRAEGTDKLAIPGVEFYQVPGTVVR